MISLASLFAQFPFKILAGIPSKEKIANIRADSRKVQNGDLFVAIAGEYFDGHQYISAAIGQGAAAVVGEKKLEKTLPVPYIRVENARQALAHLAAAYYGHPAHQLTMIGVTGTDGKTTTTNYLYRILLEAGIKAGMISTVNAVIGDQTLDTGFHVTTPDALETQHYLARMRDAELTHVVLETTSHGWAQHRVDACEFDLGIITNITHEHLDYHGSYEAYRAAKGRLFKSLAETKDKARGAPPLAILNRDDASYEYLARITRVPKLAYGMDASADIRAKDVQYLPDGIEFTVVGDLPSQSFALGTKTNLVGGYNISNALAAFSAAVHGLGISPEIASRGIAALEGIPGRMERIDLGQAFTVIVDFAHTPNALRVAIESAREMTKSKVITVFGSAGLRDKEKRRLMAEVSAELADFTVLTAEDPRTESLREILAEMAHGAIDKGGAEGESFWRIEDRGAAIRFALQLAAPGDVVLICGKGHERSMCFGKTEYPWDDRLAARAALAAVLGIAGETMPYLPTQG
jgi:UDP-N-acetylmuramoyl-L-alanyl-D-glutamate--2,6-diaminopimelate ligase